MQYPTWSLNDSNNKIWHLAKKIDKDTYEARIDLSVYKQYRKYQTDSYATMYDGRISRISNSYYTHEQQTPPTGTTKTRIEERTMNESSESETIASTDAITSDSSIDDVKKENPTDTVSQLRRKLDESGLNSSSISDSELEKYKKEADEKGIEFTKYVSDVVQFQ